MPAMLRTALKAGQPSTINYLYPFRSLFTKRSADGREFTISETENNLVIKPKSDELQNLVTQFETATSTALNTINKSEDLVYATDAAGELRAQAHKPCASIRPGTTRGENLTDESGGFLRFTAANQRGCLSFGMPNLLHSEGYLVAVESRHITGRPLQFALINATAKHTELETYLSHNSPLPAVLTGIPPLRLRGGEGALPWQIDYFILPPLAPDGIGYDVYITNDSIGRIETINDIRRIRVFRLPYPELVNLSVVNSNYEPRASREASAEWETTNYELTSVSHPNPAYYKVETSNTTLILNQSFDPGWKAYILNQKSKIKMKNWIAEILPFVFGEEIKEHVLVNNWANGWQLHPSNLPNQTNPSNNPNQPTTIIIFFLPQLLQFFGLTLLPLPFLVIWKIKHQ